MVAGVGVKNENFGFLSYISYRVKIAYKFSVSGEKTNKERILRHSTAQKVGGMGGNN